MKSKKFFLMALLPLALLACSFDDSCDAPPTADQKAHAQQEQLEQEAQAQVGMPAITHFREKRLLKQILETRDQEGLVTYTYLFSEMKGKLCFLFVSNGFGIPYSTQYTNPQKITYRGTNVGIAVLPQADPNGLFSPSSADATWDLTKEGAQYVEPKQVTLTYRIPAENCW